MEFFFYLLGALLVASAIGVVVFRNPVYSAFCLIGNLLAVAVLYAMLDAHFLATAQVIVYAGAIMVLFVFVLMLLNTKLEFPSRRDVGTKGLAIVGGAAFAWLCIEKIANQELFRSVTETQQPIIGSVKEMGVVLFNRFVFPFEIASLLIMVGLVGAVMLGQHHKKTAVGGKN